MFGESLKAMIYFEEGDLHLLIPETKETLAKAVSDIRKLPQINGYQHIGAHRSQSQTKG